MLKNKKQKREGSLVLFVKKKKKKEKPALGPMPSRSNYKGWGDDVFFGDSCLLEEDGEMGEKRKVTSKTVSCVFI